MARFNFGTSLKAMLVAKFVKNAFQGILNTHLSHSGVGIGSGISIFHIFVHP